LKDEEAIGWCKRILKLSLDKGNKLKEGHGGLPKGGLLVYVEKRKEGGGGVRKNFLVLMCGEVLMGSVYGKMKHGMELWVASYRSEASGLLV
jgi:hypothetical protein